MSVNKLKDTSDNTADIQQALDIKTCGVAVIGLGYVGMPLAVALADHVKAIGFDVSEKRVTSLQGGVDYNNEIDADKLINTPCTFTANVDDIADCKVYVVAVPTPTDKNKNPDLGALEAASKMVGGLLKAGDIVVYESTVYPGVTEDICGAWLEDVSGMKSGEDFFLGYSPERINPGDKKHTVQTITKVVSGQTTEVTELLAEMYSYVSGGNIFKAKDIKTAEASKAIENAQRDINVAFVNEITMILNKMGLSAYDVLEAAQTKWNFLPFVPGLVGGHCISVDPYYLAKCAEEIGHSPEVILSGRKINDNMGGFIGDRAHALLQQAGKSAKARILVLGFTFKENINDVRNTKVVDVLNSLKKYGYTVDTHDPHADREIVEKEYGISLTADLADENDYDMVILLVAHDCYKDMTSAEVEDQLSRNGIIFDMKALWRDQAFSENTQYICL